jgi:hypothetical protein
VEVRTGELYDAARVRVKRGPRVANELQTPR